MKDDSVPFKVGFEYPLIHNKMLLKKTNKQTQFLLRLDVIDFGIQPFLTLFSFFSFSLSFLSF